jgi:HD-GYP domain-containing protein (c-di-GMP phosphodiesterase class II)
VVDDAYDRTDYDFSGTRAFDEENNYRSKSLLTVPLKPRGGEIIGALQLVNAMDEKSGEIIPFGREMVSFIEALAAQAATALYNRTLLEKQEALMDSLIQLMAGAIDAKSQYTGAHCKRVPTLARMLAEEACKADSGVLEEFSFTTRDEWREFEIGAWLHDCGKVITPEYVVDKATKLETIYNRIHEVRTRFEVLLRDAEIAHLKALLEGADPAGAVKELELIREELFNDFEFVAASNVGGEFMADEDIGRLKDISARTWQRNFDIRKGLSHIEEERFSSEPDAPCEERLLSDKEFHVVPRDAEMSHVYRDGNFQVDIPDDLYNQGELYNLSIQKGTLTDEERFKINEHVMQTIVMLEQLPLPTHMKRVPEYAGTHHENLRGCGYPRKLSSEEISIPARIMAIADIFEALTAADRPYKKPKSLSEAIKILSYFKKDNDIDPVLFDLFLTSGIYRRYAEQFLKPEQIDEVDIEAYLG